MVATSVLTQNAASLDTINELLLLDSSDLYQRSVQALHTHLNSWATYLIEVDKSLYKGRTLSYAGKVPHALACDYSLKGTVYEQLIRSKQKYVIHNDTLHRPFHDNHSLYHAAVITYIGVPLYADNGDILGILLSTFHEPPITLDAAIELHCTVARIVRHHLVHQWMNQRFNSLAQQLSYEISHDSLTNLFNRNYLSDQLEYLVDNNDQSFTLAYLDIDNFKSINDLYGHYIGDQVIKFVANVIFHYVNKQNQVFRISGDEFAFITFSNDPLKICQLIIDTLNQGYRDANHHIKIRLSIGIAKKSLAPMTADQLILNASLALKDCKKTRLQQVRCYDTHLNDYYYRRTQIVSALRAQLDNPSTDTSEIYIEIQPIVYRDRPNWSYFEVLARWNNKQLGPVSPLEFIEVAEQSGLIIELGERIIELACQAKQVLEKGLNYKVTFGINCSAHEFAHSSHYLNHLNLMIQQYGFHPSEFIIEMTESVLLTQTGEVSERLNLLRGLGFKIALDDFGTGYSSLNYIHSYPIDCIKIDATFIRNLLRNKTSEHVISLIIQLAKQLNVDLIAEGVENQQELDKLYEMGCDAIQGYYFSKPQQPLAMIGHLQNNPPKL
ncbi:putative bifunctional diguanylate cyclase/phosphodiesterase [Vibrio metschnikovii]|uniref:putative bifunctional diguanylate cyclase/phosphodiesterase n=1 Tax=Vibrio metschnikovii TaxID=28172 RepID=UPI001C30C1B0|nr:bifunctional diguanylate cyclase/phosphodiesterase [Vibrio metschnikovii]EKO3565555.1 bifunctional diguanylate cyclase/phosphodiesterase [Vibrio metschnikovii]EKO3769135.1 bifunctional diguanylate cyclase/phosphodiesterase [Vibrio metschnikovii]